MNAIFNQPLAVKIGLLALVLFLVWQLTPEQQQNETQPTVNTSSDYGMTNFTITAMNQDGKPARIIQGTEMLHYPVDDSTEIMNPIAEFIEAGKDTWVVTSRHGHTQGKGESILLTGNVIISNKDNPDFKLLTEKLTLDTVDDTAYTDQAVTIYSPQGETHSVGLHADLKDETVNLHSRVRGHYDAPAN